VNFDSPTPSLSNDKYSFHATITHHHTPQLIMNIINLLPPLTTLLLLTFGAESSVTSPCTTNHHPLYEKYLGSIDKQDSAETKKNFAEKLVSWLRYSSDKLPVEGYKLFGSGSLINQKRHNFAAYFADNQPDSSNWVSEQIESIVKQSACVDDNFLMGIWEAFCMTHCAYLSDYWEAPFQFNFGIETKTSSFQLKGQMLKTYKDHIAKVFSSLCTDYNVQNSGASKLNDREKLLLVIRFTERDAFKKSKVEKKEILVDYLEKKLFYEGALGSLSNTIKKSKTQSVSTPQVKQGKVAPLPPPPPPPITQAQQPVQQAPTEQPVWGPMWEQMSKLAQEVYADHKQPIPSPASPVIAQPAPIQIQQSLPAYQSPSQPPVTSSWPRQITTATQQAPSQQPFQPPNQPVVVQQPIVYYQPPVAVTPTEPPSTLDAIFERFKEIKNRPKAKICSQIKDKEERRVVSFMVQVVHSFYYRQSFLDSIFPNVQKLAAFRVAYNDAVKEKKRDPFRSIWFNEHFCEIVTTSTSLDQMVVRLAQSFELLIRPHNIVHTFNDHVDGQQGDSFVSAITDIFKVDPKKAGKSDEFKALLESYKMSVLMQAEPQFLSVLGVLKCKDKSKEFERLDDVCRALVYVDSVDHGYKDKKVPKVAEKMKTFFMKNRFSAKCCGHKIQGVLLDAEKARKEKKGETPGILKSAGEKIGKLVDKGEKVLKPKSLLSRVCCC
jgi:hypothetical protein